MIITTGVIASGINGHVHVSVSGVVQEWPLMFASAACRLFLLCFVSMFYLTLRALSCIHGDR